ncbi:UDP-N-acetylmuramoyl-L-alanyl-D-glutamate--2,6-diaminopimelate ligase [Lysobacter sp. GX 14042]|uniref:UDP-N-acetylmuramoyl-L-alanyl-D-glutamate--2, 6-diaminopimelate ligase n=1 Tax=Lysobacter sp. GX 14042 TaxID=2907155 RepID=UPI001F276ED4|nr:UDP-N-acetylmuramoyl-L-alanyl-D-glutamate--2,6-diaminopimelate ligase [Lysobacter sp. GX 14042]MCE7031977.1 UDP-N-acetylmuramoyl-L-alanyl-D-glutamate--2,6-diaminopimelate ligase [Lysobacter sp. GX 14042]
MPLARLLPDVPGLDPALEVTGLVMDSRQVGPGDSFVAIAGFGTHGLAFVEQARQAGAAAVLYQPPAPAEYPAPADAIAVPGLRARLGAMADEFHGRPSAAMDVVGVTGTNGKTSTVQLLAQAWAALGVRAATLGTLGVGLDGQLVPTGFTTPLVLQTHELLGQLRDAGATAAAMEVSSHALDQGRVDGVHFDVAVFTNLSRDHLDYHGDMRAYGAAKARLFAWPGLKAAVVNLDDPFGRELAAALPEGVRRVGVSSRGVAEAGLSAVELQFDDAGIGFELATPVEQHTVRSPLLGRFNVDNLLAVAGALLALGVAPQAIAAALGRLQPVHGRMTRLGGASADGRARPLVVVDYAHTPDALQQALEAVRAHAAGRVSCVFGCGGERDRGKRPQMAAIARDGADIVIVTDDNPRGEDGDAIVADILPGFGSEPDGERLVVERDRRKAIDRAVAGARAGDIVLVAGKGHEPYQEIGGVRHPFDDAQVARAALERWT